MDYGIFTQMKRSGEQKTEKLPGIIRMKRSPDMIASQPVRRSIPAGMHRL